ncbi:hypothetical protein [Bacillus sp. FJAT-45037]|uniref:hypothetical protein n=1 Tax=Bacillus sp. FJAT-45037 TaxID=2011007 RepID=UPI0012FE3A0E|nr:hypothetical protein [Bacillus sp. FJAT-45037]
MFIATLPNSQYSYVKAFIDMKSPNCLTAHIHAWEYFGGVPETMGSDNLKVGVTKPLRGEPVLQKAYKELTDYYHKVIVPSRVRKPKDYSEV